MENGLQPVEKKLDESRFEDLIAARLPVENPIKIKTACMAGLF